MISSAARIRGALFRYLGRRRSLSCITHLALDDLQGTTNLTNRANLLMRLIARSRTTEDTEYRILKGLIIWLGFSLSSASSLLFPY